MRPAAALVPLAVLVAVVTGVALYAITLPAAPPPERKTTLAVLVAFAGHLLSETVADVLKETHPRSKVFGLSLKDRSAILPTGKRPDGAYWYYGTFGTSDYYAERVHPWVASFNNSKAADRWFGTN